MKIRQIQLGEIWRGNSVYRLIHLKGERSRFIVTKQEPLSSIDDRTYRLATELTLCDAMNHWEKLFPNQNED